MSNGLGARNSTSTSVRRHRCIDPGTGISLAQRSGTSTKPISRAASAGNADVRSGVTVNHTLTISSISSQCTHDVEAPNVGAEGIERDGIRRIVGRHPYGSGPGQGPRRRPHWLSHGAGLIARTSPRRQPAATRKEARVTTNGYPWVAIRDIAALPVAIRHP